MKTNVINIIGIIVTITPTIVAIDFINVYGSSFSTFTNGILLNLFINFSYDYSFITPHHI